LSVVVPRVFLLRGSLHHLPPLTALLRCEVAWLSWTLPPLGLCQGALPVADRSVIPLVGWSLLGLSCALLLTELLAALALAAALRVF
jgi:hypothetical protein